jgi:GTPase SAR1 family protein
MVELNHRQRTIKIKIVYYGPAVGGKTTNLQVLHQNVQPQHRGELVSINSAQDRTILFDLLPVKAACVCRCWPFPARRSTRPRAAWC